MKQFSFKTHRLSKVRILSEKWTYLVYKSNWILNSYLGINWKPTWFLFQWILSVSPFKMRKRIQYVILKRLSLSFRSLRKFEMEQLIFTSDSSYWIYMKFTEADTRFENETIITFKNHLYWQGQVIGYTYWLYVFG